MQKHTQCSQLQVSIDVDNKQSSDDGQNQATPTEYQVMRNKKAFVLYAKKIEFSLIIDISLIQSQ